MATVDGVPPAKRHKPHSSEVTGSGNDLGISALANAKESENSTSTPEISQVQRSLEELNAEARNGVQSDTFDAGKDVAKSATDAVVDRPKSLISWPWIPLKDPASGKEYFFNALTNETAWTLPSNCTSSASSENKESPVSAHLYHPDEDTNSTLHAVNATKASDLAQKAWQDYWNQWQKAQVEAGNVQLGISSDGSLPRGPSLGLSEGASVGPKMSIFVEHRISPNAKEMGRPARQQCKPPDTSNVGYVQGSEEYNIWYGKHLSDRWENGRRDDREKATTRCNPFTDSGWTRADLEAELDRPVICIYFAKGCCYQGSNCRYYHRVPTAEDDEKLDELHDIFGRERFASHKDDMTGVGSFSDDCRTLFVGDLKVHRVYPNAEEKTDELIRQQFGLWGPFDEIKVIRNKNMAFVTYKYRVSAEFAKVAMAEQRLLLDREDDQINVRWAHPGRNNGKQSAAEAAREWEIANKALMKRLGQLGYTQDDIECQLRWEIQQAERQGAGVRPPPSSSTSAEIPAGATAVAPYPNTDDRVIASMANSAEMAKLYPEVKKIMALTGSKVPVPLADQIEQKNTTGDLQTSLVADDQIVTLERMASHVNESTAEREMQKLDSVLSRLDSAHSYQVEI